MSAYREIFEKLPDGITLHDPADGALVDANEQFCEMLGYTREEVLSAGFDTFLPDEPPYTRERALEYIQRAATEGPQTFEWVDETRTGEHIPVEVHLHQATIDGEQRVLAVVREITERKERERELERRNEQLETFASVVSHDLRNPLNVAQGRIELAQDDCDSEHLAHATRAHERMADLIDDLLTLARHGQAASELEPVDLAAVGGNAWRNVETPEATLHTETDRSIMADQSRLQQLLENLLRNAVEHGGPAVTVTLADRPDGFAVVDDGPGIDAADRAAVFEPGYSTSAEGTGFGLMIAQEIAEAHGWSIELGDGPDGGLAVEITGVRQGANVETAGGGR